MAELIGVAIFNVMQGSETDSDVVTCAAAPNLPEHDRMDRVSGWTTVEIRLFPIEMHQERRNSR